MSRLSPDRRPPCGKTTINQQILWLGGCYQTNVSHTTGSLVSNAIYPNVTKVPDYASGSSGNITPYARPNEAGDGCGSTPTCGNGSNGQKYCGIPSASEVDTDPGANSVPFGIYTNSFGNSTSTQSLDTCHQVMGQKRVYARKAHHGIRPLNSRAFGAPDVTDWCGAACAFQNESTEPDSHKYLSRTTTATYEYKFLFLDPELEDTHYTAWGTATANVNRYSGATTATCSSGSSDGTKATADKGFALIGSGSVNIGEIAVRYNTRLYWNHLVVLYQYTDYEITGNGQAWQVKFWLPDGDGGDYLSDVISVNLPAGSFGYDRYTINVNGGTLHEHEELTVTANGVNFRWYASNNASFYTYYEEKTANTTLSGIYSSDDVMADLIHLASQWQLGDDERLPWQTGMTLQGPLVTYNEPAFAVEPQLCAPSTVGQYTEDILGKPTPYLVDKFWNPRHENRDMCLTEDDATGVKFIADYGAWSTDCGVPCATQWLDQNDLTQVPDSAFIGNNFYWTTSNSLAVQNLSLTDCMYLCKMAEIIIPKPSIDFSRPHSIDRLAIETDSGRCVESYDVATRVIEFEDADAPTNPFTTGDYVYVSNCSTLDGVWQATVNSTYQITLSTFKASASMFPTEPFESGGGGMVAKLKQFTTTPGLAGRVDIVNATPSNPVTCSLLEAGYLITGDTVSVTGATGNTSLNGSWTVTVIDSASIVLNSSTGIIAGVSQSYVSSSGQMYIASAPDWAYYDKAPKHEFIVKKWKREPRLYNEWARLDALLAAVSASTDCSGHEDPYIPLPCGYLPTVPAEPALHQECGMAYDVVEFEATPHCLAPNACKPSVVYFSPNSEHVLELRYRCHNAGFGSNKMDYPYGQLWQGKLQQYMTDPFADWTPPCPCILDDDDSNYRCVGTHTQDDGNCNADSEGVTYYAGPHLVEPRIAAPSGAPTTINDRLHILSLSELASGCSGGIVASPPENQGKFIWTGGYNNYTYTMDTPYHTHYLARQGCVCADGRFADTYSYGVSCPEVEPA